MNELPDDVIAKIFASSDHASKACAMFANKSMFKILDTYDDVWTDAEFKKFDKTMIGFFNRHRVRRLRLTCTPADAMRVLLSCSLASLETLSMHFQSVEDLPVMLGEHLCLAKNLKHLDITFDHVERTCVFSVPRVPSLQTIKIHENSDVPRLIVAFPRDAYPDLVDVDVRCISCMFGVATRCTNLRRVCLHQTLPLLHACFEGLELDLLELDINDVPDAAIFAGASIRRAVLHVRHYASFRANLHADIVAFVFSTNECYLDVHHDAIRFAETVTFVPGDPDAVMAAWNVNIENVPFEDLTRGKIHVADHRTCISFVDVQFNHGE